MEQTRFGAGVPPVGVGGRQVTDSRVTAPPAAMSVNGSGFAELVPPGPGSGPGHLQAPGGERWIQLQAFTANAGHGARSVRFVRRTRASVAAFVPVPVP